MFLFRKGYAVQSVGLTSNEGGIMARNLEALKESGKFTLPSELNEDESEFFASRVEWRLERLRRTDFDLVGEHAVFAQEAIDLALSETKRNFT